MRKNVLAMSIAAMIGGIGFAGAASAAVINGTGAPGTIAAPTPGNPVTMAQATSETLQLSQGGVGHMLLVPYYSAQNNNMTVLHVVNTDTLNGKAVKVRFRGAANSDDVMDFQVYMSPADVWTAAVKVNSDGVATIETADNTCTVPALGINAPKAFSTARLNPNLSSSEKNNQTREGYVEIFTMADIPSDKVYGSKADGFSDLYAATKHVKGVAPCSVAGSAAETTLFNAALDDYIVGAGGEADAAAVGFNTPTTGLMGDWYIMNVAETTTFAGASTAVSAIGGNGRGNFVHFPQINDAVATPELWTADPLFRGATPRLAAGKYDLPDMSTPYVGLGYAESTVAPLEQATFLTAALAVTSVTNQFANDDSITAKTDWLFSMPTRRYSVAADYAEIDPSNSSPYGADYRVFSDLGRDWFTLANTSVDSKGNICVAAESQRFWDREETTAGASTPGPVFSPQVPNMPGVLTLCGEASVLSFKDAGNKSVLASDVARSDVVPGYMNGWGRVDVSNTYVGQPDPIGLPLLGSAFIKLTNPQAAPNTVGTYGITWPHRTTPAAPLVP